MTCFRPLLLSTAAKEPSSELDRVPRSSRLAREIDTRPDRGNNSIPIDDPKPPSTRIDDIYDSVLLDVADIRDILRYRQLDSDCPTRTYVLPLTARLWRMCSPDIVVM